MLRVDGSSDETEAEGYQRLHHPVVYTRAEREFLRRKWIAVPATDVDGGCVDDVADGSVDDVDANESVVEDMVAGVLPVHATTVGDVDPESEAPRGIQRHTAAPISSTQQQQTDAGQVQTQRQTETGT